MYALQRLDWVKADAFCRDENMRLLTVETYEEDQIVFSQVKSMSSNVLLYLIAASYLNWISNDRRRLLLDFGTIFKQSMGMGVYWTFSTADLHELVRGRTFQQPNRKLRLHQFQFCQRPRILVRRNRFRLYPFHLRVHRWWNGNNYNYTVDHYTVDHYTIDYYRNNHAHDNNRSSTYDWIKEKTSTN